MGGCVVAVIVVLLCLVGCVWIVLRDARTTGGFMLTAGGWKARWPLYALAIAAAVAVALAGEIGC